MSSDGDVSFDAPADWTAEEESWSYGAPDRPFEYQSLQLTSPDGAFTVGYSADYENVAACQPIEWMSDLQESAPITVGTEVGDPVEVLPISMIVETPDGFGARVMLVERAGDTCVPVGGFAIARAYRFVSAGATLPTLDEARAWLTEHRETALQVVSSFRVLQPFD